MGKRTNEGWVRPLLFLAYAVFLLIAVSKVFADKEIEIDMGDQSQTSAPAAKPAPAAQSPQATSPVAQPVQAQPTPVPQAQTETTDVEVAEPTATPIVAQGTFKTKYFYQAGMKSYKEKDYERAITYLKQAAKAKRDRYTPKYVVAEANAMLGVIYQFHIINYKAAYHYYLQALAIDPTTKTAKKHIKEVKRHLKKKD